MATIERDPDVLDDKHYNDGEEVPADEKITYAIGDKYYEIDLTTENADKFRGDFEPWTAISREVKAPTSARRASAGATAKSATSSTSRLDREQTARIREWAGTQGITLNPQGRIKNEVRKAYFDAHPSDPDVRANA